MQKTFIEFNKSTDEAVNEFEKDLISKGCRILGTVHDWQITRYDVDGTTKTDSIHKTVVCYTEPSAQGESSATGKKTGFKAQPGELGGAWMDKFSEESLSCSMHNGRKFRIKLAHLMRGNSEGEWVYETPKEKLFFRVNKSDNPKAPLYRIFNCAMEEP